jgi:hypothetical protein
MMAINSLTFSFHASNDRADRIATIDKHIGWGQIVKERYYRNAYHCLTDTGVILIVDDSRSIILTLYMADRRTLQAFYGGKAPQYLVNRVRYNVGHGWVNTIQMYHKAMKIKG